MNHSPQKTEPTFNTDHKLAIVQGWLIVPAISTFFTFLGALIMIIFVNPYKLTGFDLYVYLMDVFFFILLIIIYYFWLKRKQIFPKLIIVFFFVNAVWAFAYYLAGYSFNPATIAISLVWIIYFLRSKRVQQTFID